MCSATAHSSPNQMDVEKIFLQPFEHLKKAPTVRELQTEVWLAFNHWLKVPKEALREAAALVEEFAVAIVMADDLADSSRIRRGVLTAHLVYGKAITIYSTLYGTVLAMKQLLELNEEKIVFDLVVAGLRYFRAQGLELYFANSGICPDDDDFIEIALNKTASGFLFSFQIMQVFATKNKNINLQKFMDKLGIFFEIFNDYISLKSHPYSSVKVFAEDITEGKFIYPFIHAIKSRPEDHRIINILKQRPTDLAVKKYFLGLLEEFGSMDHTLQTLKTLVDECIEEMAKIERNPKMETILISAVNNIQEGLM